jgi:two-component system OmpR family sensor kinase
VVEPDDPAYAVRVNPTAVGLALTNVIENAVKFSPAGGQVRVGLTADGPDVVIQVSDTGPGIDPRELPRLFDRFHRGAMARGAEAPGFGLGLAISRAAIERQGGRLSAENRSEGGARFTIRLPLAG